jgi:hypothetical protein
MPQIIIKNMSITDVKNMSKQMIDELAVIVDCPREYFTIEVIESKFIIDGDIVKKDPFVQVNWFDRGQDVQDKAAEVITKHICDVGYGNAEIFFIILERNNYYENGKHL